MLNHRFSELVRKYEKYKRQERNKILKSLLGLMAVVGGGFLAVTNSEFILNSFKQTTPEPTPQIQTSTIDDKIKSLATTQDGAPTAPVTPVVTAPEKPLETVKVTTPQSEDLPNKVYKRVAKKIEESNQFKLEVKERKNLYKLLTDDKEQNSYKSAVNVAQFYFDEKNYDQAVIWAVKASKRDPKENKPWIIYANSKVALGNSTVAKKALSVYLNHTPSKEAQDLLDSLK